MSRTLVMATRGKQDLTIRDLCYFAGVMDSDGCFSISKMNPGAGRTRNPRYVFAMVVVNTSETLMKWLMRKFGGRYKTRRKVSENHKDTHSWFIDHGKTLWLLKRVEPHLVVKGPQARLAIQFLKNWKTNHGMGARTDDSEVERRERCYLQMKQLNRVGPVQPQRLSPLAPVQAG